MADMDDFFSSLASDVSEDDSADRRAKRQEREAAELPTNPADEVPKLEYPEWFHEESKDKLHHNTGESLKRRVQTELYRCQHLYYSKRYEECLEGYKQLFEICDGNLKKDAEDGILHCYCKLGKWQDAVQLATNMTKRLPRIGPAWLKLGDVILSSGTKEVIPAIKAFQTALNLSPQLLPGYTGLGKAYATLGADFSSFAKRCFRAALILLDVSEKATKAVYHQSSLRTELETLLASVESAADIPEPFVYSAPDDAAVTAFEAEWFKVSPEVTFDRLHIGPVSGGRGARGGGDDAEEEDRDPSTL
eukprot:TRINITY_DN3072_c0_g1_i1.p1 TRINITY_DN3072_c0_g1~~TRINITY_DN3072_c0_g1_i1.p1  ORF type:complete len:305 (-),score=57.86 TRINITY_DN3072_c0_g1_i1:527-1441(-)